MAEQDLQGHLAKAFPETLVSSSQYVPGKGMYSMQTVTLSRHEVELVADFMRETYGNDFSDKLQLISSKLGVLCKRLGYDHFYEMWDSAKGTTIASAAVRQQIVDELMTSYTYFYREHVHFSALEDLIANRELPVGGGEMRVWCAGCATGEEPYNVAMVLENAINSGLLCGSYHVVGSDISSRAIDTAQKGRYDVADVARMPPHWRNIYCMRSGLDYEVKASLRENVEFRCENVLAPRPDQPFDVVMCRNMLIYFDADSIKRFCELAKGRVKPGGYLFLGHAEIVSDLPGFEYVQPSLWRRDSSDDDYLSLLFAP